ncbi:MAG: hypothetical protein LBN02_01435 [Oscillospiraceae bacterium]|jgi:hypothetical protein|nr:hypothetical protein [Oscillospiraceae bacterium]
MAKSANRRNLPIFLFAAAMILLAALYPLSGDDWQWGTGRVYFAAFNGRYAGNLIVQLLVRLPALRPIIVGGTIAFIAYAVAKLGGGTRYFTLSATLLVFVPQTMYTQVFQWTSGFVNYTLSVALILAVALIALRAKSRPIQALALPLAFVCQLFAEHITVATVLLTLAAVVYARVRRQKLGGLPFALIGFVLGAAAMFTNPAYLSPERSDAHAMPKLAELLHISVQNTKYMVSQLFLLNVCAVVLLCALMYIALRRTARKDALSRALGAYFMLYAAWIVVVALYSGLRGAGAMQIVQLALAALFAAALIVTVLRYVPRGIVRTKLGFCLLALIFLNVPLVPVEPLGPRCFFVSYCVYAVMIVTLTEHLRDTFDARVIGTVKRAIIALCVVCVASKFWVYAGITRDVVLRERFVDEQIAQKADTIVVLSVDDNGYAWQLNPVTNYYKSVYKDYRGIPQTVEIENR